jgi:Predicted P-loop-containing kinase
MQPTEQKNVVIVSGMSGSGKSTALNVFEDMGLFLSSTAFRPAWRQP